MDHKTLNVYENRIDEQTLETLQLGVKHFQQQNFKEAFILALVVDHLKIDLTPEVIDEVKRFVRQFNVRFYPTLGEALCELDPADAEAFRNAKGFDELNRQLTVTQ
jgi:hypothetical protein